MLDYKNGGLFLSVADDANIHKWLQLNAKVYVPGTFYFTVVNPAELVLHSCVCTEKVCSLSSSFSL